MMSPELVFYFAYGSNMSTKRLRKRIPEAKPIGIARLLDYRFVCNKESKDGSSKGNISQIKDAHTWGVVFELPRMAILDLDRAEGGYRRISIHLTLSDNDIDCETYISDELSTELPYGWYMSYILEGAREHGLPESYIHAISQISVKEDKRAKE